jgi:hypothetical protein
LSEAVLSGESCASERVVSSAKKTIGNRIRTPLLYRFRGRSKQGRRANRQFSVGEKRLVPTIMCETGGPESQSRCLYILI